MKINLYISGIILLIIGIGIFLSIWIYFELLDNENIHIENEFNLISDVIKNRFERQIETSRKELKSLSIYQEHLNPTFNQFVDMAKTIINESKYYQAIEWLPMVINKTMRTFYEDSAKIYIKCIIYQKYILKIY